MANLKSKAYRGVFWQISSTSLSAFTSIGFLVVMSRLLTPDVFGEYALVLVIIGITQIVTQFGFGPALIYLKDVNNKHISIAFIYTTAVGIIACCVLVFLAPYISSWFDNKVSPILIQMASLGLLLGPIGTTSRALLARDLRFGQIFWVNQISTLIGNYTVAIVLALKGFDVWSLLLGVLASQLLASLLFLYVKPVKLTFNIDMAHVKTILGYGSGLFFVQILNQLALQMDKIVISKFNPLELLGSYERALRVQNLPLTYIGKAIDGVAFSILAKLSHQNHNIGQLYFPFIALLSLMSMYFSIYCYLFADEVIRIVLGAKWTDSVYILQWLSVLIFVQLFSRFGDTLVRATKQFAASVKIKMVYLCCMLIFSLLGFHQYGFEGMIGGIVLAHVCHSFLMIKLSIKITSSSWLDFHKSITPVIVLALVTLFKGISIEKIESITLFEKLAALIISDLVLIFIFISSPLFFGRNNVRFISNRLKDIPLLSTLSLTYDKYTKITQK